MSAHKYDPMFVGSGQWPYRPFGEYKKFEKYKKIETHWTERKFYPISTNSVFNELSDVDLLQILRHREEVRRLSEIKNNPESVRSLIRVEDGMNILEFEVAHCDSGVHVLSIVRTDLEIMNALNGVRQLVCGPMVLQASIKDQVVVPYGVAENVVTCPYCQTYIRAAIAAATCVGLIEEPKKEPSEPNYESIVRKAYR